ncbi:MAG: hypothetical protein ACPG8O_04655 [Alcanivorax nanhaiticus]
MDENGLIAAIIANSALLIACLIALRLHAIKHHLMQSQEPSQESAPSQTFPYRVQPGALIFGPFWAIANGLPWIALCYLLLIPLNLGFVLNVVLFFTGERLSWRGGNRWQHNRQGFEEENYVLNFLGLCMITAIIFLLVLDTFS